MRIALDCDGVLLDSRNIHEFLLERYAIDLPYDQWTSYYLHQVLGISPEEEEKMIRAYYDSPYFLQMKPLPGAVEVVQELAKNHELLVLTARDTAHLEVTQSELAKHYGSLLANVICTSDSVNPKKESYCLDLGVQLLIEDSKETCIRCAGVGVPTILLDYPYNQGELPSLVRRVSQWHEITRYVQ